MGRSKVTTILQPTDYTCGPASVKHALAVLGKRKSMSFLTKLCKTSRNGTTTKNMIQAMNALGLSVLTVEKATLRHMTSALKHSPKTPRAVIVDYLYTLKDAQDDEPWLESGHWAAVSSYRARDSKIVLFDSYSGTKKSYFWSDFRERWFDFDIVKKKLTDGSNTYKSFRRWQKQLLLVVASDEKHLPKFRTPGVKFYPSVN